MRDTRGGAPVAAGEPQAESIEFASVECLPDWGGCTIDGVFISLTPALVRALEVLVAAQPNAASLTTLRLALSPSGEAQKRIVTVQMHYLRRCLAGTRAHIENTWGGGYALRWRDGPIPERVEMTGRETAPRQKREPRNCPPLVPPPTPGAQPEPFKAEDLKSYTCVECTQLFRIGASIEKSKRDFCRKCGRVFYEGANESLWLPRHPWAWRG